MHHPKIAVLVVPNTEKHWCNIEDCAFEQKFKNGNEQENMFWVKGP